MFVLNMLVRIDDLWEVSFICVSKLVVVFGFFSASRLPNVLVVLTVFPEKLFLNLSQDAYGI